MFLFAALAIVWVVIVGYLVVLSGRLSALQRSWTRSSRRRLDATLEHDGS